MGQGTLLEGAYVYGLVTAAFGLGAFIGAVGSAYLAAPNDKTNTLYVLVLRIQRLNFGVNYRLRCLLVGDGIIFYFRSV